ncbi:hypothetical protein CLOM_g18838 [Closterium sp. NIES-68]|nr:hypothetical protein CLOM_g18838 [Closterium sp. NIES-68]
MKSAKSSAGGQRCLLPNARRFSFPPGELEFARTEEGVEELLAPPGPLLCGQQVEWGGAGEVGYPPRDTAVEEEGGGLGVHGSQGGERAGHVGQLLSEEGSCGLGWADMAPEDAQAIGGSPKSVMSSAYARQRTLGNAAAVAWSAGCMAAAKSRGPIGSPCRTPRALRSGPLLKPASR